MGQRMGPTGPPVDGRLEVAHQGARLVDAHPELEVRQVLDGIRPSPPLRRCQQADDARLGRFVVRRPGGEPALHAPGLHGCPELEQ